MTFHVHGYSLHFLFYDYCVQSVRDASTLAAVKLDAYAIQKEMREDVYRVVLSYKAKAETLDSDRQRYLDKVIESYQRNGLGLPPDKQKRLKEIKTRISELCIQYQQNLNEDVTTLKFTRSELEGMSEDFLASLTRDGDKYVVTLKYPHVFPILQKCKVETTRRAVDIAKDSQQQAANVPLLEEILLLRQEEAKLLGYKNHAEYILAIRMAKTPESVLQFLTELNAKLEAPAKRDIATLLHLKEREKKERNEPFDGILHSWDWRYYHTMRLERDYKIDKEVIRQYFPCDVVVQGVLALYQELLDLRFALTPHPHVCFELY
jgi:Zn-dependent oligopeptidase